MLYFDQTSSLHAYPFIFLLYYIIYILNLVSLICCALGLYAYVTPDWGLEDKTWVSLFESKATLMLLWLTVIG